MKKNILKLILPIAFFAIFFGGSCNMNDYPINIPISIQFSGSTTGSQINANGSYCLSSNQTYNDYKDKLKELKFAQAAWRTTSVTMDGISDVTGTISGNVTITLTQGGTNTMLFNLTVPNIKPAAFINTPLVLTLDQNHIALINNYLSSLNNQCFNGSITATFNNGSHTYVLNGYLDLLFTGTVKF